MLHMIFVDLSHNERIQSFPDRIFQNTNMDMLVSFNSPTDDLTDFALEEQDLVILGHPRPVKVNETEPLFTRQEVKKITSYVAHGGNLLLTSGARGDYNFEPAFGSLRAFSHLTGITQFHYTVLFHQQAHKYLTKRWNIVVDKFPDHPIFQEMTSQDSIVLGKSTYFTVHPSHSPTVLLSDPNTQSHNYATKTKQPVGSVPILTAVEYGQGRVVTVASSSFLTRDTSNGVTVESNTKWLQGICRWLLSEEGP